MNIRQLNAEKKVIQIKNYLVNTKSILDFGCGDLAFARGIKDMFPKISVTAIDTVDFNVRYPDISYKQYDGGHLHYQDSTFDTVIAWHVFHHTEDSAFYFKQCMRVAKKRVIFVEPLYRYKFELPGMIFSDWLFNVWKQHSISMTFSFHPKEWWINEIKNNKGKLTEMIDVELLPKFSPTGRSYMFVIDKH